MRRKHRPTILTDERDPLELKLVTFGVPPTTCTLNDRPAVFGECMDCEYRRGARGLGIALASTRPMWMGA
jgi:hypothetical protein